MSELTNEFKTTNGYCCACGPERNADVLANHREEWQHDENGVHGYANYRILQCRGCAEVYFQTAKYCSEDNEYEPNPRTGEWERQETITHWPAPTKYNAPTWAFELSMFDWELSSLFDDIYTALNHKLYILAAIGIRTAFDCASKFLGIEPELTFAEKLAELNKLGKISNDEEESLSALIEAGSAAAHRGWKPTSQQLELMLSILETFLHRNVILGEAAKKLKKNLPIRNKVKNLPTN